ncbi:MAG: amino acid racemase [Acidobacteria bacterium]|nr:amino acid racemase [Acidobacteriota bacterium]
MNDGEDILGILGGMGPHATAYFFQTLLNMVPARTDQQYPRILIDCHSAIPDRTRAILGQGPSPVPAMLDSARRLAVAGVRWVVMPCITAHFFLPEVRRQAAVDFVDLLEETARWLDERQYQHVGVLTTTGSRESGIFQRYFQRFYLTFPPADLQENSVMAAIYGERGAKSGDLREAASLLAPAVDRLITARPQVLLMGCTEIPLILRSERVGVPLVDPMVIGAAAALQRMGVPAVEIRWGAAGWAEVKP